MHADELRALLQSFSDEYIPPATTNREAVLNAMIEHLGNPDPVLRDGLIYEAMTYWTLKHGYVSIPQFRQLAATLIDDQHLFYNIDQHDQTSVFQRTFSALWLAVVVNKSIHEPVLTGEQLTAIAHAMISYLQREHDLRGYTSEHGWAHGVAHASDVVKQLARCDGVDQGAWLPLLDALGDAVTSPQHGFVHEEDERAASALIMLLEKQRITEAQFLEWIKQRAEALGERDLTNYRYVNTKHLIRSLYAQTHDKPNLNVIHEALRELVFRLHQ